MKPIISQNLLNVLKNKIIKATTKHFKEDPLRVYRVARFASQLGFEVEKNERTKK